MSGTALALVLAGAICHAVWNIVAKKASGGAAFVFLFGLVSVVAATPVAAWAWLQHPQRFDATMWCAAAASALVHVFYSLVLQKAYREADFAIVYPVARGSGPMFSVLAAVLLLGEQPSWLGWIAVAAIIVGVFVVAGVTRFFAGSHDATRAVGEGGRRLEDAGGYRVGASWGLATGVFIATYTLIDGWAIRVLGMMPILFYASGLAMRTLLLAPFALRQHQRAALRREWQLHRTAVLAVGILSPTAYALVLFAVQRAPLSYVAPVREISMLVGTFIGAALLKERVRPAQAIGALIMLAGVLGLAYA